MYGFKTFFFLGSKKVNQRKINDTEILWSSQSLKLFLKLCLQRRVIPKTFKMLLDTSMLNTQQYKYVSSVKWSN